MELHDLSGVWQCAIPGQQAAVSLPGTLDTNGIGFADTVAKPWHPDENCNEALAFASVIATRLTRKHTYEGPAAFSRTISVLPPKDRRVFLECERARHLTLKVNGADVPHFTEPSISTPHVFEITGLLTGCDELTLISDNSYPGWPREDIVYSSAATDETQTNWNGVLGYIRLRIEKPTFIAAMRAYPVGNALDVCAEICAHAAQDTQIALESEALLAPAHMRTTLSAGHNEIWLRGLPIANDVRRWDEGEGYLHELTAKLNGLEKTVSFGVRDFAAKGGRLTLNGRNIFLRSEANCAVFPETGHWPMDADSWKSILSVYKSYGVNCMRFHSHCPPEAAFTAADEMGMLMQPELSHWNPRNAFSSAESRAYYRAELTQVLRTLANHPSFVMLSFGNELHMGEGGQSYADSLLKLARAADPTRLYASGSNNHYGAKGANPADGFYSSFCCREHDLRATSSPMQGWLNERYPDLRTDYAPAMSAIRKESGQPVISFEVGQYEVLPDFDELTDYQGVTDPANIRLIRDNVQARGLLPEWKQQVSATGELSLLCYRAEVEAALRTDGMSGISLLGLQDFPGQGTALVGMLNSHLKPKPFPFAKPERFAAFFTGALPLVLMERMTYTAGETLCAHIRMANYGKHELSGTPTWTLSGEGFCRSGTLSNAFVPCGGLYDLGMLRIPLVEIGQASRLTLTVSLCSHSNTYDIWVYPDIQPICPSGIYECRTLDDHALSVLASGKTVYLAPDSTKEALPCSIKAQFSTDFWSVGTFPAQPGGMGQWIDAAHPIFSGFPTDSHTNWQWWPMASQRAIILPRPMRSIVAEMDSYAYLRPMTKLLECRCHGGHLLISSMGLHSLLQYPEARALQKAIYDYLGSTLRLPSQEMTPEEVRALIP